MLRGSEKRHSASEDEEKRVRISEKNLELDEEDSDSEEEEDENRYEIDGFVVADDDIEEVDEDPELQGSKSKKLKKSRKRLKKRAEDSDSQGEDRALIADNITRNSEIETYKQAKYSSGEDEEENEEGPTSHYHSRSEYTTIARIFAYEKVPQPTSADTQPEFEPAEKKERFKTQEFETIRAIDIPERLQHRLRYRENPDQDELSAEIEWIYSRLLIEKKNAQPSEALRVKIARFLMMYRVEKYEIPFIHMYRKHLLYPEIENIETLWDLEKWDVDWGFVYENKSKIKLQIVNAAENAAKVVKGEALEEKLPVLRSYDGPGYVPLQVWELLNSNYNPDFACEIQDLQKYVDAFIYMHPIKNTSDPLLLAQTNRIPEFLEKAGINPLEFSENLKKRELLHKPSPSHISSEDAAFDLLCDLYKDEGKVKSVAQSLAKKEISSLPWTRKFVREEYRKHVKLFTTPTEIGKTALDIYHPQYKTKHLVGKELSTITPDTWADIWKSERNGWIQTEFKLPWKGKNEDKILSLLLALYLSSEESEIDANWNSFRLDILKSSLVEMYEDFSKELYDDFCLKAEDFIINNCKRKYLEILTKPALLFDEEREKAKILVIVTDPLIEFFGQSAVVVMDCNGVVVEIGYFRTLAARSFESLSKTDQCIYRNEKRDIEKMILAHHPRAVVIAANSLHSVNIRKYLLGTLYGLEKVNANEHSMSSSPPKVTMHDVDVAKLFASSQRAKSFLPDGDVLLKTAVSLGRYIQMPLSEALGLWSDPNEVLTLFLPLDPMQKLVNQKRLEWQLENVACESVSKVGVDINRIVSHTHMQSLLRFIPGLGPAKAYFLLESIYKKFKGKLKMRAAIISKRLLTSKVYENAAGFIFIRYEERETEPLDSTRIHPEHYEMAHKIAKSALVLPDNHREDEAIAKIIRDPKKVNELELQIYADRLEQVPGRENMMMVLNFIAKELESPFFNEKKSFKDPSETELLYLVSGEGPTTLSFGKLVHCTVITSDDRQNLVVKLESGLKGTIDKSCICADREPSREEMKSFAKGLSLTARVLEVSGRVGRDNDIYFSIKLSVLPADLTGHQRFLPDLNKERLDNCFVKAEEDWDEKEGLEDDEYRQGQKYVPRVVNHPRFKNIGLKTACEELENRDIGECLFRPSSRGLDHLTCTWKFYHGVYAHLDIEEEGKPAANMLGTKLKISDETYESLQEIIDRYIMPCEKLTKEALANAKFKDFQTNIISTLKLEKKQNPNTIPYYFTILEQYPQFLILYYLPKEKPVCEYIKVKPRGLFFHEAYHTSLNYLISWFKRHHSERSYQSQVSRTKAPVIDTTNHYAVKGRAERPMTPLLYQGSTSHRVEDSGDEISYHNPSPESYDDRRGKISRRRSRGDRFDRNDRGENRDDRKCKRCGMEGHYAKNCMKSSGACYNCGKEGHFAKECAEKRRRPDDQHWMTPMDTPEHTN